LEQLVNVSPKASPVAFLLSEELEARLEDRADSPHISEVPGEVSPQKLPSMRGVTDAPKFTEDKVIEHLSSGVLGTDTPHVNTFMPGEEEKASEEAWVSASDGEVAELAGGGNVVQHGVSGAVDTKNGSKRSEKTQ
jgi:hypothetical protein